MATHADGMSMISACPDPPAASWESSTRTAIVVSDRHALDPNDRVRISFHARAAISLTGVDLVMVDVFEAPPVLSAIVPRARRSAPRSAPAGLEWWLDDDAGWVWIPVTQRTPSTSLSGWADIDLILVDNALHEVRIRLCDEPSQ